MGTNTVVVVESLCLVREAMVSLLTSKDYRAIGCKDLGADAGKLVDLARMPRLVILGARSADQAASDADSVRKLWPGAKTVLLFDGEPSTDLGKLLEAEIDAIVSLLAGADDLFSALGRVLAGDIKVLLLKNGKSSLGLSATDKREGPVLSLVKVTSTRSDEPKADAVGGTSSLVRVSHGLSERQEEILIGLTKGHSNKMIARSCGITEATIKVHMKSVLQKIRVTNRTQAAIWALEKGYGAGAHSPMAHAAAA